MSTTTECAPPSTALLRPVGWVGRTVLMTMSYLGGAVLLSLGAVGWLPADKAHAHLLPGFGRTMIRQLSWMLALGLPLVGLVHMAMGSFLALQAYYGSTFIDGTGAVVGVGLLRNLGGMMSGMILAALLATRMIPELRRLHGLHRDDPEGPLPVAVRMAGPRIAAAAVACPLLALWGVAVGTVVGWQASTSMMGLSSEMFFMMMKKMMWFRDVVGLVIKGVLFGLLPAAICCHEALRSGFREADLARDAAAVHADAGTPLATPVFRATCLGIVSILIVSMSWFMLVYHAVPFYGPTLLKPPVAVRSPAAPMVRSPGGIVISARFSAREIWVGLIVIVAIAGLIGLVGLASDGPGFLAPQRTIDVVFRDGQGIRVGSPVRVAGLDTGNVVDTDMVEVDGTLRAKVRISLPANLVKKLRQDVKVTIQPALTGMSHVNIVSTGHSGVPLVAGQMISGVETSLFDPLIEQVGLGPGERNDIRHMIGEIRQTVDATAPRLRQFLASLEETSANMRELSETIRPAVESTIGQVEDLTKRLRVHTPRIESTLVRVDEMSGQLQGIVAENRESVRQTMASVRDLTATMTDVVGKDRVKVERLLDGLDVMRARSERVLYQADQIAAQVAGILVRGRTEIERSVTNVRDATDWGNKLVQKIYANPFVLSPFYKPNHEDLRVQGAYDTALVFTHGAQELRDAVKTLESMTTRPADPQQQQEIERLQQRVLILTNQLGETSQRLAESLKQANGRERLRR